MAHGLKGLSGNLGLNPIYQAVCGTIAFLRAQNGGELDFQYNAAASCPCERKALVKAI